MVRIFKGERGLKKFAVFFRDNDTNLAWQLANSKGGDGNSKKEGDFPPPTRN